MVSVSCGRRQHAPWSELHKNEIITLQWDKSPSTNKEVRNAFLYCLNTQCVSKGSAETAPKEHLLKLQILRPGLDTTEPESAFSRISGSRICKLEFRNIALVEYFLKLLTEDLHWSPKDTDKRVNRAET